MQPHLRTTTLSHCCRLVTLYLNFSVHQNHMEDLLNQIAQPQSEKGPHIYIFLLFPDDTNASSIITTST